MTDGEILAHLQDLVDYPHEDLNVEIKGWLDLTDEIDKANLAKSLMAIANHCGGYIAAGFRRDGGNYLPDNPRPSQLGSYNDDVVNGIVLSYAEPAFHCQVHHVTRTADGLDY